MGELDLNVGVELDSSVLDFDPVVVFVMVFLGGIAR